MGKSVMLRACVGGEIWGVGEARSRVELVRGRIQGIQQFRYRDIGSLRRKQRKQRKRSQQKEVPGFDLPEIQG
jgi:hypothetical protein